MQARQLISPACGTLRPQSHLHDKVHRAWTLSSFWLAFSLLVSLHFRVSPNSPTWTDRAAPWPDLESPSGWRARSALPCRLPSSSWLSSSSQCLLPGGVRSGRYFCCCGFIAGIGYNLRKGRTPDCHCFGKVHSEPIGPATLVRDGAFALVAAIIVLFGWNDAGASLTGWFGDLSGAEQVLTIATALLAAAVAGMAWLLLQVVRQNGRLLLRIDAIDNRLASGAPMTEPAPVSDVTPQPGLPVGTPAPGFRLDGIYGESQTLDALLAAGKPVMLIFSSPTCGPCTALMPDIGQWQRTHADKVTVAVIGQGDAAANRAKSVEHGLTNVLLQNNGEVSGAYQAKGTPTAVLITADGSIASPAAAGAESIRTLFRFSIIKSVPAAPLPLRVTKTNGNGQGATA